MISLSLPPAVFFSSSAGVDSDEEFSGEAAMKLIRSQPALAGELERKRL